MKNRILNINKKEKMELSSKFLKLNYLVIEIDGKKIKDWKDYINILDNIIHFPDDCTKIRNRYIDWLKDLEWLNKEGYIFIINNYSQFMKDNPKDKQLVYEIFYEDILPFWDDEVERVVVGGKKKPCNVYLVD